MTPRTPLVLSAALVAASSVACGGGTAGPVGSTQPAPVTTPVHVPATAAPSGAPATAAPTLAPSTQQVVTLAEPVTAIGSIIDPTFGLIGGYTQTPSGHSQVLAFAPGSQIMIANGQSTTPHTFTVLSTTGFTGPPTSATPAGGSTIGVGFNSGNVNPLPAATLGPFTLTQGTFYIGCFYHYLSENMRTVLVVAPGATPGPQATAPPAPSTPPPGSIY